ncbi:hypothetical protein Tco_0111957 [Tanacetum coccineum]
MVLKDYDGIPKRLAMFLNLWRYKVVRHRYSNPMIQPELEGSTQGYPLVSVEVLRFYTSAGNPVKEILLKLNLPDHRKLKDGGEGGDSMAVVLGCSTPAKGVWMAAVRGCLVAAVRGLMGDCFEII